MAKQSKDKSNSSLFFSVIVPYFDDQQGLIRCLEAILLQDFPVERYEVLVVDDHSPSDIAQQIQSDFPIVQFHRLPKNRGPGAARNYGIKLSRGTYLAFTDSDACPGPGWLTGLSQGLAKGHDVVCGPVWHGDRLLERYTALTSFGEYLDNESGFREHCPSVNYAVSSSVIKKILYDETIKFAGEDMVLSTNLVSTGCSIFYSKDAWVMHCPKLTFAKYSRRAFLYGIGFRESRKRCARLSGYWLHKYLGPCSAFVLFFARIGIDSLRLVKHRKLLKVTPYNTILFVLCIILTRLCYSSGVFWSYLLNTTADS